MAEKDKRSSASFVPFKPLDNLFEPTIQEKPVPGDSLQSLPLDDLHAFKDHPFRLYTEHKMAEMVESIQEHGVITPILPNTITAICYAKVIGDNAVEQIRQLCDCEFSTGSRIRIMLDAHAGKGCTIGTTMTVTDKAVPNLVRIAGVRY